MQLQYAAPNDAMPCSTASNRIARQPCLPHPPCGSTRAAHTQTSSECPTTGWKAAQVMHVIQAHVACHEHINGKGPTHALPVPVCCIAAASPCRLVST